MIQTVGKLASWHKLRRTVLPSCLSFSTLLSPSVDPEWQDKRTDLGVWQSYDDDAVSLSRCHLRMFSGSCPRLPSFRRQRLMLVEARLLHLSPGSCNRVRFKFMEGAFAGAVHQHRRPSGRTRAWKPEVRLVPKSWGQVHCCTCLQWPGWYMLPTPVGTRPLSTSAIWKRKVTTGSWNLPCVQV